MMPPVLHFGPSGRLQIVRQWGRPLNQPLDVVTDVRWARSTRRLCRRSHTTVDQTSAAAGRTPSDTVCPSTTASSEYRRLRRTAVEAAGRFVAPAGRCTRTPAICSPTGASCGDRSASAANGQRRSTSQRRSPGIACQAAMVRNTVSNLTLRISSYGCDFYDWA